MHIRISLGRLVCLELLNFYFKIRVQIFFIVIKSWRIGHCEKYCKSNKVFGTSGQVCMDDYTTTAINY